jgi:hypothetical protein
MSHVRSPQAASASPTGRGISSANWRWNQYGYTGVVALAASSAATCSDVNFQPAAIDDVPVIEDQPAGKKKAPKSTR